MLAAYLTWAAGQRQAAQAWHLASALPLAAALIRFAVLTARPTAVPVEDLLTRDPPMLTCELAWLALFAAGL
jgi:decaprenyl-phosphate phosphoribosyltransferase